MAFQTSGMNSTLVLEHLRDMRKVYDEIQGLSSIQLYEYLLKQENDYIHSNANNYAKSVHMLHPLKYKADSSLPRSRIVGGVPIPMPSLQDRLVCPACNHEFSLEIARTLHIDMHPAECNHCLTRVTFENLDTATFRKCFQEGILKPFPNFDPQFELLGPLVTWKQLIDSLGQLIKAHASTVGTSRETKGALAKQMRSYFDTLISSAKRTGLTFLSMDLVKGMYVQLDFINKICSNFDYWCETSVLKSSIARYEKFMTLIQVQVMQKKKNKMLVPTLDIDLVWHAHQTNPTQYETYCRSLIHKLIDHDDTVSGGDLQKAYARTFVFWSERYHEAYSPTEPEFKDWNRGHSVLSILVPPVGLYRWAVWKKHGSIKDKIVSDLPPQATLVMRQSDRTVSTTYTSSTLSSEPSSASVEPVEAVPIHGSNNSDGDVLVYSANGTVAKDVKVQPTTMYSVVGTPVNDERARPQNDLTYLIVPVMAVGVLVPAYIYYNDGYAYNRGGCGGGGCSAVSAGGCAGTGCGGAGGCAGGGCGGGGCGGGGCGGGGCGGGG